MVFKNWLMVWWISTRKRHEKELIEKENKQVNFAVDVINAVFHVYYDGLETILGTSFDTNNGKIYVDGHEYESQGSLWADMPYLSNSIEFIFKKTKQRLAFEKAMLLTHDPIQIIHNNYLQTQINQLQSILTAREFGKVTAQYWENARIEVPRENLGVQTFIEMVDYGIKNGWHVDETTRGMYNSYKKRTYEQAITSGNEFENK